MGVLDADQERRRIGLGRRWQAAMMTSKGDHFDPGKSLVGCFSATCQKRIRFRGFGHFVLTRPPGRTPEPPTNPVPALRLSLLKVRVPIAQDMRRWCAGMNVDAAPLTVTSTCFGFWPIFPDGNLPPEPSVLNNTVHMSGEGAILTSQCRTANSGERPSGQIMCTLLLISGQLCEANGSVEQPR